MTNRGTALADENVAPRSGTTGQATGDGQPFALRAKPYLPAVLSALIFVCGIALWKLATMTGFVSSFVLAPPLEVLTAFGDLVSGGQLWPHLTATVKETLIGLGVSVGAALVIGSVFSLSPVLRKAVYPYILATQTFPKVAIAPLVVAALGYGLAPKVVLAVALAFFPLLVNTMAGLTEVSEDEINLFRSMRASKWQELRYLRIPNALAFIFPALNSAAVLALIGAIVGEFVSARVGIGYAIKLYSVTGAVASTYAMLIVLAIFGLVMYGCFTLLERVFRKA